MTEGTATPLAPVAVKARIDVLDMLRGLAILGIFFMNIPLMSLLPTNVFLHPTEVGGWTPIDQAAWWTVRVFLEGTQRGLLEMLFGAGLMVLAAKAMVPDGPVEIADIYWRRNLWLLAFGLIHVFLIGWPGDILHMYALAALFLFPFRKLGPKVLLALSLGFALFVAAQGASEYRSRSELAAQVVAADQKEAAGVTLSAAEKAAQADWAERIERRREGPPEMQGIDEAEEEGRTGNPLDYLGMNIGFYMSIVAPSLLVAVAEAFCVMLLGMALWKWGVIQGERSARFYLVLMLACYIPGLALRAIEAREFLLMTPVPKIMWMTQEASRIAVSVGHLALVNLLVKFATGRTLLAPFKAAGRTAFSLYIIESIIGMWILFAPWGPGLWDTLGWAEVFGVALAVQALLLVVANLWVRRFAVGPLEWVWRSLAYWKRQPMRIGRGRVATGGAKAMPA